MNAVVDASPLIHLSAAGELRVLRALFDTVLVPRAVFEEVVRGADRPGAVEVREAGWLEIVDLPEGAAEFAELRAFLDLGEASAIALTILRRADLLLIDERAGRAEARRRGILHVGTLGILIEAKRQGELGMVRPALEAMLAAGMRVTDAIVAEVLELAGEAPAE